MRMKVLDSSDPAYLQIAFVGFKDVEASLRAQILKEFATTNFPDVPVAGVEHAFTGPRNKRQLTETSMIQFFSRDSRDVALKQSKDKKVMSKSKELNVKVEMARTRVQKCRNWAMRKAFELIQVEISKQAPAEATETNLTFHWEMPVRQIKWKGDVVFEQKKIDLRGNFCGPLTMLTLPE